MPDSAPLAPASLDRAGRALVLDERFAPPALDVGVWIPHYLPQWASRAATAARYDLDAEGLHLRIDPDQAPWSPEWNESIVVSNLQTGVFSGPVGSGIGQHRFRPDLVVREAQQPAFLMTPHRGIVELRARASRDDRSLSALWMIGLEDDPARSAEICVMEVFGRDIRPDHGLVGVGVHPFGDPGVSDDFEQVRVEADLGDWHEYAVDWARETIDFFLDERHVKRVAQRIDYPMQLMLNLYHFPPDASTPPRPARFDVRHVRVWGDREGDPAPAGG